MTSTSMKTVLLARVIGQLGNNPMGQEAWPSHTQRVIVEGANSGDPSCFQTEANITQVDAPSSVMHQEMLTFQILTGIWKVTEVGRGGCSDCSRSKKINPSSIGSIVSMIDRRASLCERHNWRSSSIEMGAGYCAKSSTMLYRWAILLEATFQRSGP